MAKKILVIDDEEIVAKSLQRLLKKGGDYAVITAQNHDEALERVKGNDFNLIISDIRMPGQDGVAIIKDIRTYLQENNKKVIPEILITGYADEDKYQSAIDLGVKAYMNKPFDIAELLETVKSSLGKRE